MSLTGQALRDAVAAARAPKRLELRGYNSAVLCWVLGALCVWAGFAVVGVVLVLFGALLLGALARHRRVATLSDPLARARQALDIGDVERCEMLLDGLDRARSALGFRQWIGILRAHVAFSREDPAAAADALTRALGGARPVSSARNALVAVGLALRALAYASLELPGPARDDLAAHDAHAERNADTIAPARLAEALLLAQRGEREALDALLTAHATALLNRLGPSQRRLIRALATDSTARGDAYRTAAHAAAPARVPARVAIRQHVALGGPSRPKGAYAVAALLATIVAAFWLPVVLAWQGLGIAVLTVTAFAFYTGITARRRVRGARQLQTARTELVWGDHHRGREQLVALANGREPRVAIEACVHLAIDAEERGDFAAALDACDAGLARIESSSAQLATRNWTAPKLTELNAYLRAALGQGDRSQRELAALQTNYPDYPFVVSGAHRVRLMQAAHEREWGRVAELDDDRAPTMTVSARDELLARVGRFRARGATEAELAQLEAELQAFPSHEHWLEAVVPGALNELGSAYRGHRLR